MPLLKAEIWANRRVRYYAIASMFLTFAKTILLNVRNPSFYNNRCWVNLTSQSLGESNKYDKYDLTCARVIRVMSLECVFGTWGTVNACARVVIFEVSQSVTDYAREVFTVVTVSMRAREVTRFISEWSSVLGSSRSGAPHWSVDLWVMTLSEVRWTSSGSW